MRLWICLLAVACCGCGREANPATAFGELCKVNGSLKRDDLVATGGSVRFVPIPDQPDFLINSEVGNHGEFQLSTVRTTDSRGERRPGAPPGKYRVIYQPPVFDQTQGHIEPLESSEPIQVEATKNSYQIELFTKNTQRP